MAAPGVEMSWKENIDKASIYKMNDTRNIYTIRNG